MGSGIICRDYLGNKYDNQRKMCEAYGISEKVFYARKKYGWTLEQILTVPIHTVYHKNTSIDYINKSAKECEDHLGNKYKSITQMCNFYNISYFMYTKRIKDGWDKEKALTTPFIPKGKTFIGKKCKDHLGNEYINQEEMCKAYGIKKTTYRNRIKKGKTIEEALTMPLKQVNEQKKEKERKCVKQVNKQEKEKELKQVNKQKEKQERKYVYDYLGNKYINRKEMCKAYSIKESTYRSRIKKGMTVKEALTTPLSQRYVYDHLGNKYINQEEMCKAYNIKESTYRSRTKRGATVEEALTTPLSQRYVYDHLGNKYDNRKKMCEAYNISYDTYQGRRRRGWSLEKTLTTTEVEKKSKGEQIIYQNLSNRNIDFLSEFSVKDLFNYLVNNQIINENSIDKFYQETYVIQNEFYNTKENTEKLFFDFVVFMNNKIYLIEYDGWQHNIDKDLEGKLNCYYQRFDGKKYNKKRQSSDRIKNFICNFFNIPLYRIQIYDKFDEAYTEQCVNYVLNSIKTNNTNNVIILETQKFCIERNARQNFVDFCNSNDLKQSDVIEQALQMYMNNYDLIESN